MCKKTNINRIITKYVNYNNRSHYLKWDLDGDWSIRYFFLFESKRKYTRKWVLKSHFDKVYIVISKATAIEYIKKYCMLDMPTEHFSLNERKNIYRRVIVDPLRGTCMYTE